MMNVNIIISNIHSLFICLSACLTTNGPIRESAQKHSKTQK